MRFDGADFEIEEPPAVGAAESHLVTHDVHGPDSDGGQVRSRAICQSLGGRAPRTFLNRPHHGDPQRKRPDGHRMDQITRAAVKDQPGGKVELFESEAQGMDRKTLLNEGSAFIHLSHLHPGKQEKDRNPHEIRQRAGVEHDFQRAGAVWLTRQLFLVHEFVGEYGNRDRED